MVAKSLNQILLERRDAPPRDPQDAAAGFIYMLARELLKREVAPGREVVVQDFENIARDLTEAAITGCTVEEQAVRLRQFWENYEFPDPDLRKRREARGPTDDQLRKEVENLRQQIGPVVWLRKRRPQAEIVKRLRELAPWATSRALREASQLPPTDAACELVGSRYCLGLGTVRNRVSRARHA